MTEPPNDGARNVSKIAIISSCGLSAALAELCLRRIAADYDDLRFNIVPVFTVYTFRKRYAFLTKVKALLGGHALTQPCRIPEDVDEFLSEMDFTIVLDNVDLESLTIGTPNSVRLWANPALTGGTPNFKAVVKKICVMAKSFCDHLLEPVEDDAEEEEEEEEEEETGPVSVAIFSRSGITMAMLAEFALKSIAHRYSFDIEVYNINTVCALRRDQKWSVAIKEHLCMLDPDFKPTESCVLGEVAVWDDVENMFEGEKVEFKHVIMCEGLSLEEWIDEPLPACEEWPTIVNPSDPSKLDATLKEFAELAEHLLAQPASTPVDAKVAIVSKFGVTGAVLAEYALRRVLSTTSNVELASLASYHTESTSRNARYFGRHLRDFLVAVEGGKGEKVLQLSKPENFAATHDPDKCLEDKSHVIVLDGIELNDLCEKPPDCCEPWGDASTLTAKNVVNALKLYTEKAISLFDATATCSVAEVLDWKAIEAHAKKVEDRTVAAHSAVDSGRPRKGKAKKQTRRRKK